MLNERKLTERELDKRSEAIKGLLSNKRKLVQKYGADAEKVMYGIATKQAKKKIEGMNLENLKELIKKSLQQEDDIVPNASTDLTKTVDTGFSGRADYGEEDKALGREDELEMKGLEEGHGLDQGDVDFLQSFVDRMGFDKEPVDAKEFTKLKKILKFIIKSNILQDKTKDLSKGKVNEQYSEAEIDDAVMDLRDIVDNIEQKEDEARNIVRLYFPNELSRLDGYGAFSNMYSTNRYDVTLGGFIDRLEEEGYEIEDGVAYVNEGHMMSMDDLDVGHTDNEPHMLKKELARAGQMIQMLYRAVDKYDGQGEVDFPQWWQKKIIQANAMLDSAFDYIDGEEMVAKIDAMIDKMDSVEVDIDVVNEEDVKNRIKAEKAIRQTLKDEGGAAGLKPLVKAVKEFGFNKEELIKLLKKVVKVDKHKHGDYILTPINEKELSKRDIKGLKKVSKQLKGAVRAHDSQAKAIDKAIKEDEIPTSVMLKVNNKVKNVKSAAQAMLDFFNQLKDKESIDFEKNAKFKIALDKFEELANVEDEEPAVAEKLTKRSKVDDFVDDFKKSDAKQFKGKSQEKRRKMAVAAYLAKQNDK